MVILKVDQDIIYYNIHQRKMLRRVSNHFRNNLDVNSNDHYKLILHRSRGKELLMEQNTVDCSGNLIDMDYESLITHFDKQKCKKVI